MVEMERSTLSARSRKLFTLSAIHSATAALIYGHAVPDDQRVEFATRYWDEIGPLFPEWQHVRDGRITAGDVRRDFIHSHGITLQALGRVGNALLHGTDWRQRIKRLKKLDWSRSNVTLWEGRAMVGGRVSKAAQHVTLTTNTVKRAVGVALTPDEQRIEDLFERGER
jgi:DNA sulfur modification protein DndB